MESRLIQAALLAASCLAGCGQTSSEDAYASHHGRYLGIGVYSAGTMWSRIAVPDRAADAAVASTADDEQVIVVIDSRTGEVRQCGNLTGYCIGMNPWAASLVEGQSSPVRMREHTADLQRNEANATQAEPEATANAAAAVRN